MLKVSRIGPKGAIVTTPLAVHRRLESERENAERAWLRAKATRLQLITNISDLEAKLGGIEQGSDAHRLTEARLVQQMIELQRFDRDVHGPTEELHTLASARVREFAEQLELDRQFYRKMSHRPRLKRVKKLAAPTRPRRRRARIVIHRSH